MTAVTYRFDLPRAMVITANDRPHRMVKAKLTASLRALGAAKARGAGCSLGQPVILTVHIGWPDGRRRDRTNLAPTTKALIDGISPVLLGDDSDDRIIGEYWTSEITRRGCFEVALQFTEAGPFCPVCHVRRAA